ncbi:MAG TPA: Gfo/Idh/MocA family oxidoreductase [Pseudomonadales bacterium]|nr:Gfo/Idh/MocA family oxidoreductase [Pseudomonadales bacterium]
MLRFALIGCGRIAKRHSELLGSGHIEGATLAAVCDRHLTRAEKMAEHWQVPAYADMHEMMQKENIDVVSVLTPSGEHAANVVALAPYGKHILVEKPMALTLDDADAMIRACDENNVRLFVVHQNRFNVPVVKLAEACEHGRFGKLVLGTLRVRWSRDQRYYNQDAWRGTWAQDGGVLANQAIHHIDMLGWLMGDVESVFAKSITALVDIEAEDTAVATVKFRNGALGVVEATNCARPVDLEGSISVLGEKGTVVIGGFAVNKMLTWRFAEEHPEDAEVTEKYSVNPPDIYGFGHSAYYNHVVDCLTNNRPALVDGREARKCIEFLLALYESIETGKEVFLPVTPQHCRLGRR